MGDYDSSHAALAGGKDQAHDGVTVQRVEGARGLVGEQEAAVTDDGAGDGHALAFAARELVRVVRCPLGYVKASERSHGRDPSLFGWGTVQLKGQRNVLCRRQAGQEVEVLEHVPYRPPPELRLFVAGHCRNGERPLR